MKLIKRAGFTVALTLALSVSISVASASASYVVGGSYPAVLTGSGSSQSLGFPGGYGFSCGAMKSAAELSKPTESLSPEYGPESVSCASSSYWEGEATLKLNGCRFILHPGSETSPGEFAGTAEIGPAGCGPITLKGSLCKRSILPQTGIPATFHNEGTGTKSSFTVNVAGTVKAETETSVCGGGPTTGSYEGSWKVAAYNGGGEQIATSIAGSPPIGIYLAGKESTEKANQPRIEAESYSATISGNQNSTSKYKLALPGSRSLTCEKAGFQGSLSEAAAQIGLTPTSQNCTFIILGNEDPAAVQTNGCQDNLNVLNAGPPYTGSLGISCGKEGAGIEIKAYASPLKKSEGITMCVWKMAPQAPLNGVSLENVGSGMSRGIGVTFNIAGLAVTKVSGSVTNCGEANQTGTYTGTGTLLGQQ